MGSLGDEVAQALARRLGWDMITRDGLLPRFFSDLANPHEFRMLTESAKHYLSLDATGITYKSRIETSLHELAKTQSAILVGFGSQAMFAGDPDALHIRITASRDIRISRVRKEYHLSAEDADRIVETSERRHRRFVMTVFGIDLADPAHYDLTVNTDALTVGECADTIHALIGSRDALRRLEKETREMASVVDHLSEHPVFKNPAELEFAKILDMYQIEWRYEPRTFPVEWDLEGNVTMAFSPDFFLPFFNTYIELTTMNQKYVTMKNRKAKKVRELYPGINIKIMYKKDMLALAERFGSKKGE